MTRSLCLAPMDAPPAVREAAARRFGPTTQVTYLRLSPDAYAIQGMKGDRVKEIRVTAMGKPLDGDDDERRRRRQGLTVLRRAVDSS